MDENQVVMIIAMCGIGLLWLVISWINKGSEE